MQIEATTCFEFRHLYRPSLGYKVFIYSEVPYEGDLSKSVYKTILDKSDAHFFVMNPDALEESGKGQTHTVDELMAWFSQVARISDLFIFLLSDSKNTVVESGRAFLLGYLKSQTKPVIICSPDYDGSWMGNLFAGDADPKDFLLLLENLV